MIRNIIFDMGDVLLWFRPMEACRALCKNETDANALYEAFFGGQPWVEVDHGRLDKDAFTNTVKAQLKKHLHPPVDALYQNMPENVLFPLDGMAEIVDDVLHRGFQVYLLSNAGLWMSRTRDSIPHIRRFHGVMFSADEGLVKPDPRLFHRLTERYQLTPGECFFIDDRQDNVRTAAALGWRTHLFSGDVQALQNELDTL